MKPRIIVLLKNHLYKVIKEKEICKYVNDDTKCILFPKISNNRNTVYYPVLPHKSLLSNEFHINITFDIGNFKFDEDYFSFNDRFTTEYHTKSVIDFINYISVFYNISGSSEIIENAYIANDYELVKAMYPIHYHIDFDEFNTSIDSGELKSMTRDMYLPINAFEWITEGRMYELSDILFTTDSDKNSAFDLPSFIGLNGYEWKNTKYSNSINKLNLNPDDLILIKMNEYNSYYLTNYQSCVNMMHIETMNIELIGCQIHDIPSNLYRKFSEDINSVGQIERDSVCRYLNSEYCGYFQYTYNLGDIFCLISWAENNIDILSYFMALYKADMSNNLILVRHLGKLENRVFTINEIMHGDLTKYIYEYISRRM